MAFSPAARGHECLGRPGPLFTGLLHCNRPTSTTPLAHNTHSAYGQHWHLPGRVTRRTDIHGEQFERVRRVGAQVAASVGDCDSTVEMHSVCCEDCSTQSATEAQTAPGKTCQCDSGTTSYTRVSTPSEPLGAVAQPLPGPVSSARPCTWNIVLARDSTTVPSRLEGYIDPVSYIEIIVRLG